MSLEIAGPELEAAFSEDRGDERSAQSVLEKYWWLLLDYPWRHPPDRLGVYSQVPIGVGEKQYVPDLMVFDDPPSQGFTTCTIWHLVELQAPGAPMVTRSGAIAKPFRRAYEQVLEWSQWLKEYSKAASDLFWGRHQIHFRYSIIMSRRSLANDHVWKRVPPMREANRYINLSIRTYDSLLETAFGIGDATWNWYEQTGGKVFLRDQFRTRSALEYDRSADTLKIIKSHGSR